MRLGSPRTVGGGAVPEGRVLRPLPALTRRSARAEGPDAQRLRERGGRRAAAVPGGGAGRGGRLDPLGAGGDGHGDGEKPLSPGGTWAEHRRQGEGKRPQLRSTQRTRDGQRRLDPQGSGSCCPRHTRGLGWEHSTGREAEGHRALTHGGREGPADHPSVRSLSKQGDEGRGEGAARVALLPAAGWSLAFGRGGSGAPPRCDERMREAAWVPVHLQLADEALARLDFRKKRSNPPALWFPYL